MAQWLKMLIPLTDYRRPRLNSQYTLGDSQPSVTLGPCDLTPSLPSMDILIIPKNFLVSENHLSLLTLQAFTIIHKNKIL